MKIPELKGGQMVTIAYLIGILIILFIVYKILAGLGLIKTEAKKKQEAVQTASVMTLTNDKYFDPEYFRSSPDYTGLTVEDATNYADRLRSAMAGIGTDEQTIFSIFADLPSKVAISEVSNRYKAGYGFPWYTKTEDLKADLLDELTPDEVDHLMNIINTLPNS